MVVDDVCAVLITVLWFLYSPLLEELGIWQPSLSNANESLGCVDQTGGCGQTEQYEQGLWGKTGEYLLSAAVLDVDSKIF